LRWQHPSSSTGSGTRTTPTPKPVTDNLDNFSNRGDSRCLSIPSTPQDKVTLTLALAPALPCSKVIAVTEVIGYRRGHPCKWRRLDNLGGSPLTPRFLLLGKLAISLDPLRICIPWRPSSSWPRPQYQAVASKMLQWSSTVGLVDPSLGSLPGSPLAPSSPYPPERSRPHHSYYDHDPSGCLRTIFPRAAIVLQKDVRDDAVDARGFRGRSKTRGDNPL